MNETVKTRVMDLLNNYATNQRKIAVLRYELEHPSNITSDEMIDAMSFAHSGDGLPPSGHISDKTLYIALNYQDKMDSVNRETTVTVAAQLWELERDQERLMYYVSLLDAEDAAIIQRAYFEGKTSEEISAELGMAPRYVRKRRTTAVNRLCELYEVAGA